MGVAEHSFERFDRILSYLKLISIDEFSQCNYSNTTEYTVHVLLTVPIMLNNYENKNIKNGFYDNQL